jgi:fatty acid synthase
LIKEAIQMSVENKIGGIFHLASSVEDMLFEQQYPSTQVHEVLRKITEFRCQGAFNLDKLTRGEGIMDEMAYFVVFSPVLSQITTPTVLEKICESRRRVGRHGLALHWGCNVDNGLMVEQMFAYDNIAELPTSYVVPSRVFSCLKIFETLLYKSFEPTVWSHYVPVDKYWIPETTSIMGTQYPYMTSPYTTTTTVVPQYKSLFEVLLTVLGVKDMTRIYGCESMITLGELGLDSVLALELKQLLETVYTTPLTLRDIQMLTLEKLRLIESRFPQGIFELYQPRPLNYLPRLRSVLVRKTVF